MQVLGQQETLAYALWPVCDENLLINDTFNLPIQVEYCFPVPVTCVKHLSQLPVLWLYKVGTSPEGCHPLVA